MGWEVLVGTEFGNPSIEIPNGATELLEPAGPEAKKRFLKQNSSLYEDPQY